MSVGALRGNTKRDARRLCEQMANPVFERLVGVGHPFALMHELEPGFDRECLYESPDISHVFVHAPCVRPRPYRGWYACTRYSVRIFVELEDAL